MSSVDRHPRIVFGRTNIALTAMVSGQLNAPVREVRIDRAITGIDTIVTAFQQDAMDLDQFEYCEVIAVSPVMASASPVEVKDALGDEDQEDDESSDVGDEQHDDEEDYDYWDGPILEDRPSAEIERDLEIIGLSDVPIFGRRLLLVSFAKDLSEFDMDRAKQRVRKVLGFPVTVWQGRSFEGFCFVDNAPPISIVSRLEKTLVCDEVEDYLLVQPVAMVRKDKSGLSPLGDWLTNGWRSRPVNIPDQKSERSGRPR